MQDLRLGKTRAQPLQAQIHVVELQHRAAGRMVDQRLDVALHGRVPGARIHVELAARPALVVERAQLRQAVELRPVVSDVDVRRIDVGTACRGVEPASLVERLVIRRAARNGPEQLPEQGAAAAKAASDEQRTSLPRRGRRAARFEIRRLEILAGRELRHAAHGRLQVQRLAGDLAGIVDVGDVTDAGEEPFPDGRSELAEQVAHGCQPIRVRFQDCYPWVIARVTGRSPPGGRT